MLTPMTNPTGAHRRKRRHHGEGTVILRKDHWRAKPWTAVVPYVDQAGRRREVWLSAASRDEADQLRKDELARRRRAVPTDHTVGSYVRDWLMSVDVSAGAFDRYRQHVEQRILPTLGDVPLATLTPPDVRRAMRAWAGSAATRHGTLIVLRMAMRQARHDRMVPDDPMAGIRAPRLPKSQPTVLDVAEVRKLRAAIEGDRLAPLFEVAVGLGLRRGELLGLRTPDVDATAGLLTVTHSLRRIPTSTRVEPGEWWVLQAPKADSGRVIPVPAFVMAALERRLEDRDAEKKAARVWAPNDLVFSDPRGNPVAFSTLDNWWRRALTKAGLPHMRWHELRASTATILLAEGVDALTVSLILGHADMAMTRRYVKLLPRTSRDAADRIDKAIG
jgi:integrase